MAYEADKRTTLYGQSRELLEALERKNEILADIAGADYVPPGPLPKGIYAIQKRTLEAAQYANELLDDIAENEKSRTKGLVVTAETVEGVPTLDTSWKDIWGAFSAGNPVVVIGGDDLAGSVVCVLKDASDYVVVVELGESSLVEFKTDSDDGYPEQDQDNAATT